MRTLSRQEAFFRLYYVRCMHYMIFIYNYGIIIHFKILPREKHTNVVV